MSDLLKVRCPRGHEGPWRYVEQIEVWRKVLASEPGTLRVASRWDTGDGFNEGVPGSAYLLCCAQTEHGLCSEEVAIPSGTSIDWSL